MRQRFLDQIHSSQPYTVALKDGRSPAQIKEEIVALLNPYIVDKDLLERCAVNQLAGLAIGIGKLSTRFDWESMLNFAFSVRAQALEIDANRVLEVLSFFEVPILETQRKFALQVVFEVPTVKLAIDEYAFELFRNIGAGIESILQPFMKEFYCLLCIRDGAPVEPAAILHEDFGKVLERLHHFLPEQDLIAPLPWGIRLNQWRNMAQHHTFAVTGDRIIGRYGKSLAKSIELSREELLSVAVEVNSRIGILRCSRVLTIVNSSREMLERMPTGADDIHAKVADLSASFATQGFALTELNEEEGQITASFQDATPETAPNRHIHFSQFIIPLAFRFPGRSVEIRLRTRDNRDHWVFSVTGEELGQIIAMEDPLSGLADAINWTKSIEIARRNEAEFDNNR
ncbi:MAG: hypothetical protein JWQ42_2837 [Edaphobacter sp.]|nr:hypothetical protein [Edaphobacter sp.]